MTGLCCIWHTSSLYYYFGNSNVTTATTKMSSAPLSSSLFLSLLKRKKLRCIFPSHYHSNSMPSKRNDTNITTCNLMSSSFVKKKRPDKKKSTEWSVIMIVHTLYGSFYIRTCNELNKAKEMETTWAGTTTNEERRRWLPRQTKIGSPNDGFPKQMGASVLYDVFGAAENKKKGK